MEDDSKVVTVMSPTSFLSEIMLVLMGLSGISVVGVNIGYFHLLPFLFLILGFSIGVSAIVICIIGIYVLLYQDYRRLKFYLTFLTVFLGLQLAFIIHLYFFTNNIVTTDEQQGSIIALDVCFGFTASALIALCFHLKQKGSTIEMVKL
jgi:cytochrome c biogenesis protein CcdA